MADYDGTQKVSEGLMLGEEDTSVKHALKHGAHDALHALTKYALLAAIGIGGAVLIVGEKRAKRFLEKVGV